MFFNHFPIKYNEPLFRPPSEAESLILQVTYGCSWNKCAFCEMYTSKSFKIRNEEEIARDINSAAKTLQGIRKIFLADGNPMILATKKMLTILSDINTAFPRLRRVSTYALPRDILSKSLDELKELREAGLKLLYVGIESGDDELLLKINKGETYNSTVDGLLRAKEAGIKLSVIIINGLGGMEYSIQHAINSAEILNEIQPEFASALVLSFPFGTEHFINRFKGNFIPMNITDLFKEMKTFISYSDLKTTIFRSNHASNYLVLSGILSRDKQQFIDQINNAINNPETAGLREEWQRGL